MTRALETDTAMQLVLGTAQLRNAYGVLRPHDDAPAARSANALLTTAVELGVDAIDTAPAYGAAEETIGEAGTTLGVHTKIDPALAPADSLAGSLKRLRRDHVDVLYVHDAPEVLSPESPVLAAAQRLVGPCAGVLGASVYEVAEFDAAVADSRIGAIQVPLHLFDRRVDDARLAEAASRGVSVYARSVLLQGVLAAPPTSVVGAVEGLRPFIEDLARVADELGRSRVELAFGWVRSLPGIRGVVVGATSVEELRALVAAFRSEALSGRELSELRSLAVPEPELCDPRGWAGPRS